MDWSAVIIRAGFSLREAFVGSIGLSSGRLRRHLRSGVLGRERLRATTWERAWTRGRDIAPLLYSF